MMTTKILTELQIKALAYAVTHKGAITTVKANVSQSTLKALANLGLMVFQTKGYAHGHTPWMQYLLTEEGFKVARIGRMFAKFF